MIQDKHQLKSSRIVFPKLPLVCSSKLPLTLISLEEWILIRVTGKDVIQYLNNQFTCDIKNLNHNQYCFSAHCNPHGKTISSMYVFYINYEEIAFIERLSVCNQQIAALRKYAIFSDIIITPEYNTTLIGIAGKNARTYLNVFFKKLPNQTCTVTHDENAIILYFSVPEERFLLIIINQKILDKLFEESQFVKLFNDSTQWKALDIESNYPLIESTTSEMFIPQSINIDKLGGINFNKGCYLGQEAIARTQYRGINKRTLNKLIETTPHENLNHCYRLPQPKDRLILYINNQSWKRVGFVLQSCKIDTKIWIQAVTDKLIPNNSPLCVENTTNNNKTTTFFICHSHDT